MPISYAVDKHRDFVLVTWKGDVTGEEYRAHLIAMLQDPDALRAGRSLTDLRQANVLASGAELNAIGSAEAVPRLAGRPWRNAVLVSSTVNYGVARQYQIFSGSEGSDDVFRDYDAALAWLLTE